MTNYNFGDVVIVPFPFSSGMGIKKRPAVVISDQQYQKYRRDMILLAVSSRIRDPLDYGDIVIQDWQEAGLLKPSILKPLVFTFEQSSVLTQLGRLTSTDKMQLDKLLKNIIGNFDSSSLH
ncbi:MAG: type II toxin-antitoxin system PemK/MazF family toxin [Methylococcales bacterium]